jgi:uncharacterized protein with NAD-binding domain and iron-sulfur cluster
MPDTSAQTKKKIAVLGGGPSSLASIWYLLKTNNWDISNYDITVYQLGWRLGGKCANGRNPDEHLRIEEHGIHFWFGCYHNSWQMLKELYEEQLPKTGYKIPFKWQDALSPSPSYIGFEPLTQGWYQWSIKAPAWPLPPADPFPPIDYVEKYLAEMVLDLLKKIFGYFDDNKVQVAQVLQQANNTGVNLDDLRAKMTAIEQAFQNLIDTNKLSLDGTDNGPVQDIINLLVDLSTAFMTIFADYIDSNIELHKLLVIFNLGLTIVRGMFAYDIFTQGFDVINQYDLMDWFRMNGAAEMTLNSTLARSYYDGAFAFLYGRTDQTDSEAGTTLSGLIYAFVATYGAMIWKMEKGGLGEIFLAPLYTVLKHYGVKFEFFHKVEHLTLSADKQSIASVQLSKQVNLIDGLAEYDPLIEVKGVRCWLSQPKYNCLKDGAQLKAMAAAGMNVNLESFWTAWPNVAPVTLTAGTDYDEIVFGISAGAIPYLCTELMDANENWKIMAARTQTVQTQSVQLWLTKTAEEIGWPKLTPPDKYPSIFTTFVEPLDTWASAAELIAQSEWPFLDKPKDIFYFVGVMQDPGLVPPPSVHGYPAYMKSKVRDYFITFLNTSMKIPFPLSGDGTVTNGFNWNLLYDTKSETGIKRLDAQYWRANIDPTERYVLTAKGTSQYRMSPGSSGFTNLIITGDWTKNFLNTGCFEGAIMSAIEAAAAITGKPALTDFSQFFKLNPKG